MKNMIESMDFSLKKRIRAIRLLILDFDGVFTDNMVYVFQDGSEAVRCFRGDGMGLSRLEGLGISSVVLSTETNPVVQMRCEKLKIPCVQGCRDKGAALDRFLKEMDLSPDQVAYLGNDINDLPCLDRVGLPMVVQDAHPEVISRASYRTRARGGHGAVREVCDLFESVRSGKATGSA